MGLPTESPLPMQRHEPSLELFPESTPPPLTQMGPPGPGRPEGWRSLRCHIEGVGSPGPSWRGGQGSVPACSELLPPRAT